MTEKVKTVFAKENTNNLALIPRQLDLSSLTHNVPWVIEELDAVDGRRCPWFYSGWLPKESIGRTDHFVDHQCIDWHFWRDDQVVFFWAYPNHDSFTLALRNHFLGFLLPTFFFFSKVQSKIGVCIIHGRALYWGKYGKTIKRKGERVGNPSKGKLHERLCTLSRGRLQARAVANTSPYQTTADPVIARAHWSHAQSSNMTLRHATILSAYYQTMPYTHEAKAMPNIENTSSSSLPTLNCFKPNLHLKFSLVFVWFYGLSSQQLRKTLAGDSPSHSNQWAPETSFPTHTVFDVLSPWGKIIVTSSYCFYIMCTVMYTITFHVGYTEPFENCHENNDHDVSLIWADWKWRKCLGLFMNNHWVSQTVSSSCPVWGTVHFHLFWNCRKLSLCSTCPDKTIIQTIKFCPVIGW